jgi:plasmid stability protein
MFNTCNDVHTMTTMIQIRNVPDDVHRTLKARAALAGTSLSDLIRAQLIALAALPSEAELKAYLTAAEPFAMTQSSAGIVRRERDAA